MIQETTQATIVKKIVGIMFSDWKTLLDDLKNDDKWDDDKWIGPLNQKYNLCECSHATRFLTDLDVANRKSTIEVLLAFVKIHNFFIEKNKLSKFYTFFSRISVSLDNNDNHNLYDEPINWRLDESLIIDKLVDVLVKADYSHYRHSFSCSSKDLYVRNL